MNPDTTEPKPGPRVLKIVGRYAIYEPAIASGGMATVHIGRLIGRGGFSRTVAIKKMHPHLAQDPAFVSMFMDEARLAGRIRHPNVIGTIDVVASQGELFLVMEYVHGESFSKLLTAAQGEPVPLGVLSAILVNTLDGLHAAHDATNDQGEPLRIVHRDVSPQNIIIGVADGLARVLDFGVAKAADGTHSTQAGQIKGKIAYMAPEQMLGQDIDRRTDVYAAAVVLWQGLTGQKLFTGPEAEVIGKVAAAVIEPPSKFARAGRVSPELDQLVLRALSRKKDERFETAAVMARALQKLAPIAPADEVAAWARSSGGQGIEERARRVAMIEAEHPLGSLAAVQQLSAPFALSSGRVAAERSVFASGHRGCPHVAEQRAHHRDELEAGSPARSHVDGRGSWRRPRRRHRRARASQAACGCGPHRDCIGDPGARGGPGGRPHCDRDAASHRAGASGDRRGAQRGSGPRASCSAPSPPRASGGRDARSGRTGARSEGQGRQDRLRPRLPEVDEHAKAKPRPRPPAPRPSSDRRAGRRRQRDRGRSPLRRREETPQGR